MQAKNRYGIEFSIYEIVMMADFPILYPQMKDQKLLITEIEEYDACESGFMIQIKHISSGNLFKKKLDTNWFKKTK